MSLPGPKPLSDRLFSSLFGTAYLSGITSQELPAGLELVFPHGERLRTTEAVEFSATGVSQPVPIERAELDNYRPGPIPQAAPIPFVGASADQFLAQIKQATAWVKRLSSPVSFVESELGRPFFRESFLGPVPYKRYMALSNVVDEGFYSDDEMSERVAAVLDFADESSRRRNKARHRNVIPTGSPPVAEKLPVWEANARAVLAGAKRWAQRWGGL